MRPVVIVSACLLGQPVRYDGGDKSNTLVRNLLGERFDIFPLCPEAEAGLGIPRPPVQLVRTGKGMIEVLGVEEDLDVTGALRDFSHRSIAKLVGRIDGAVLKSRSPSCGIGTTPLFDEERKVVDTDSGVFAQTLLVHMPRLPVIDEEQFADETLRDAFINSVERQFATRDHVV
ncbi:MAG: DUF523 domain-containing protein [Sedimenticolaceae bacterium]|nr:DUF523 domain-containing protein [Sedimenticolaceae bacterium]